MVYGELHILPYIVLDKNANDNAFPSPLHHEVWNVEHTNQFPTLPFCGPHSKPHGARGLGKHYHLRFDPKLGMGVCAIRRIPFVCVACTSILDKAWISGIPSDK